MHRFEYPQCALRNFKWSPKLLFESMKCHLFVATQSANFHASNFLPLYIVVGSRPLTIYRYYFIKTKNHIYFLSIFFENKADLHDFRILVKSLFYFAVGANYSLARMLFGAGFDVRKDWPSILGLRFSLVFSFLSLIFIFFSFFYSWLIYNFPFSFTLLALQYLDLIFFLSSLA